MAVWEEWMQCYECSVMNAMLWMHCYEYNIINVMYGMQCNVCNECNECKIINEI